MLYLPDVNLFVYAKMKGVAEHAAAVAWLQGTLDDPSSSILCCESTLLSFLRLTTNKRIFDPPLPFADAVSIITELLERPDVFMHHPSAEHFVEVAVFMKKYGFGGDLVMDAYLAVTAMNTGATLVTRDNDFDRIPYLKTINPIGKSPNE